MRFTKKKILLIGSKVDLPAMLGRMGFDVIVVNDTNEAMVYLQHIIPDLFVVDASITKLDLERLTSKDSLPVIMVGGEEGECVREYMDNGFFLELPVKVRALIDVLNTILFAPVGIIRKHLRVAYSGEVNVEHSSIVERLRSTTLSEGGMYLRRKDPLPVGSEVTVNFTFPSGDELAVDGMVIYVSSGHSEGSPPGMAMEFYNMNIKLRKDLRHQIKNLLYN